MPCHSEEVAAELVAVINALTDLNPRVWAEVPKMTTGDAERARRVENGDTVVQVIPYNVARAPGGRKNASRRVVTVTLFFKRSLADSRFDRAAMLALVHEVIGACEASKPGGWSFDGHESVSLYDGEALSKSQTFLAVHRLSYVAEFAMRG